jgi:phosphoenolpyruvate carboxylase
MTRQAFLLPARSALQKVRERAARTQQWNDRNGAVQNQTASEPTSERKSALARSNALCDMQIRENRVKSALNRQMQRSGGGSGNG